MVSSLDDIRSNRKLMAYTASAMYGAAALDGSIEGFLPGDPKFAMLPVFVVLVMFVALLAVGPRLPRWALGLLGPIGVALIAYALATSPGPGDGPVLYSLPVLWTTVFFGRNGAIAIVALVGAGEWPIALATFDVDHFKQINDEHGHVVGDRVLVHLARVLASESRGIDVAARLGGEEFAVLMPGSDQTGAEAFVERVRYSSAITECPSLPHVRVSAGITTTTVPLEVETMLERVDCALYAAKRGGRDRTVIFDGHAMSATV